MLFSALCSSPIIGGGSRNGGEADDTQCSLNSNSMPEGTEYCVHGLSHSTFIINIRHTYLHFANRKTKARRA